MSTTRIMIGGLLFVFTVLSGVWLSYLGRPLNIALFTVHKLMGLGAVILLGMAIYQMIRNGAISAPGLAAIAVAGLLVLSLFASGALLSAGKPAAVALLTVHRAAPLLAGISVATAISLLARVGLR